MDFVILITQTFYTKAKQKMNLNFGIFELSQAKHAIFSDS